MIKPTPAGQKVLKNVRIEKKPSLKFFILQTWPTFKICKKSIDCKMAGLQLEPGLGLEALEIKLGSNSAIQLLGSAWA